MNKQATYSFREIASLIVSCTKQDDANVLAVINNLVMEEKKFYALVELDTLKDLFRNQVFVFDIKLYHQ